jgi:hypothetical protein
MSIKVTIQKALEQYRGDDLERAKAAFRGCTPEQMNQPWGESGMTRAEYLKRCEQHVKAVEDAQAYVAGLQS